LDALAGVLRSSSARSRSGSTEPNDLNGAAAIRALQPHRGNARFAAGLPLDDTADRQLTSRHQFAFQKRSQLFIGAHNETLSVAAMRVSNPDCSPCRINR